MPRMLVIIFLASMFVTGIVFRYLDNLINLLIYWVIDLFFIDLLNYRFIDSLIHWFIDKDLRHIAEPKASQTWTINNCQTNLSQKYYYLVTNLVARWLILNLKEHFYLRKVSNILASQYSHILVIWLNLKLNEVLRINFKKLNLNTEIMILCTYKFISSW